MQTVPQDLLNPLLIRMGDVLLHFVWQGFLIFGVAVAGLRLLRQSSASRRYLFLIAMFGIMALLPMLTLLALSNPELEQTPAPPLADVSTVPAEAQPVLYPSLSPAIKNESRVNAQRWSTSLTNLAKYRNEQVLALLAISWATGACLLSLRLIVGWTSLSRLRREGIAAMQSHVQNTCSSLCSLIGVKQTVQVLESTLVQVPTLVGWLQPLILFPATLITGLSSDEMRAILAHELAHVRRHDYLVNLGQIIVENFLFYHPVVWWLSARIRQERENCCDDIAAQVCGSKVMIARALTTLAELDARTPTIAPAATGGVLVQRIRRLLQPVSTPDRMGRGGIGLGMLCVALPLLVIWSFAVPISESTEAKDPSASSSTEPTEKPVASSRSEADAAKESVPFEEQYRIPEGRVLIHVPHPRSAEAKRRYEASISPEQIAAIPEGPDGIVWTYDGEKFSKPTVAFGFNDGLNSMWLVRMLAKIEMCELEGDARLWMKGTQGDYVVRKDATPEQIVADLDRILNEDLNYNVTLKFEDVKRDVYLAKGEFEAKPAGPEKQFQLKARPTYLLYGKAQSEYPLHHMGKYPEFWKAVSLRVGRRIVDESENAPEDYLQWLLSFDDANKTVWDTIPPAQFSANGNLALQRVSEQTGLTFEAAVRTIRVLSLKRKTAE